MAGALGIKGHDAQDNDKSGLIQNIATLAIGVLGITAISKINLWMIGLVRKDLKTV